MSDTTSDYQKLLSEAIKKHITILGSQITLIKASHVPGIKVAPDGSVDALTSDPLNVATRFLEEFRDLSAPLVKKTMQPLLSAVGQTAQNANQTQTIGNAMPKPNTKSP